MGDYEFSNVLHSETDYVMHPLAESLWIAVDGLSVYIKRTNTGMYIDVLPRFDEVGEAIATLGVDADKVKYSVEALEQLWDELEEIGVDDTGIIDAPFLHFPAGINRENIWRWFDDRHPRGVAYLLNVRGFNDAE